MNGVITCSVKEAAKLMEHLNEDDLITLTIIDNKTTEVTSTETTTTPQTTNTTETQEQQQATE